MTLPSAASPNSPPPMADATRPPPPRSSSPNDMPPATLPPALGARRRHGREARRLVLRSHGELELAEAPCSASACPACAPPGGATEVNGFSSKSEPRPPAGGEACSRAALPTTGPSPRAHRSARAEARARRSRRRHRTPRASTDAPPLRPRRGWKGAAGSWAGSTEASLRPTGARSRPTAARSRLTEASSRPTEATRRPTEAIPPPKEASSRPRGASLRRRGDRWRRSGDRSRRSLRSLDRWPHHGRSGRGAPLAVAGQPDVRRALGRPTCRDGGRSACPASAGRSRPRARGDRPWARARTRSSGCARRASARLREIRLAARSLHFGARLRAAATAGRSPASAGRSALRSPPWRAGAPLRLGRSRSKSGFAAQERRAAHRRFHLHERAGPRDAEDRRPGPARFWISGAPGRDGAAPEGPPTGDGRSRSPGDSAIGKLGFGAGGVGGFARRGRRAEASAAHGRFRRDSRRSG